jgi:hypothetical protein
LWVGVEGLAVLLAKVALETLYHPLSLAVVSVSASIKTL